VIIASIDNQFVANLYNIGVVVAGRETDRSVPVAFEFPYPLNGIFMILFEPLNITG
jgi:hypothetical protein